MWPCRVEAELLVLGADAPVGRRLRARFEIGDELVPRLDGRALRSSYACRHGRSSCSICGLGFRGGRIAPLASTFARPRNMAGSQERQSPSVALTRARAATAAVSARIMRGPSEIGRTKGWAQSSARSSSSNPPSGPISTASGRRPFAGERRKRRGDAAPPRRQKIRSRSASQSASSVGELLRLGHLRHPQDAALLGGLDRIGAQPLHIDALGHGAARDHRLEPRRAQLGRLLRHVIEAGALQRREQIMQVRRLTFAAASARRGRRLPVSWPPRSTCRSHSPSLPLKSRTSSPVLHRSTLMR